MWGRGSRSNVMISHPERQRGERHPDPLTPLFATAGGSPKQPETKQATSNVSVNSPGMCCVKHHHIIMMPSSETTSFKPIGPIGHRYVIIDRPWATHPSRHTRTHPGQRDDAVVAGSSGRVASVIEIARRSRSLQSNHQPKQEASRRSISRSCSGHIHMSNQANRPPLRTQANQSPMHSKQ